MKPFLPHCRPTLGTISSCFPLSYIVIGIKIIRSGCKFRSPHSSSLGALMPYHYAIVSGICKLWGWIVCAVPSIDLINWAGPHFRVDPLLIVIIEKSSSTIVSHETTHCHHILLHYANATLSIGRCDGVCFWIYRNRIAWAITSGRYMYFSSILATLYVWVILTKILQGFPKITPHLRSINCATCLLGRLLNLCSRIMFFPI